VIGLILTPSSRWAFVASSASFPWRTFFPHRVLTKVVRPARNRQLGWRGGSQCCPTYLCPRHHKPSNRTGYPSWHSSFCGSWSVKSTVSTSTLICRCAEIKPQHGTTRQRCGQKVQKGLTMIAGENEHTALNGEDMMTAVYGRQAAAISDRSVMMVFWVLRCRKVSLRGLCESREIWKLRSKSFKVQGEYQLGKLARVLDGEVLASLGNFSLARRGCRCTVLRVDFRIVVILIQKIV